MKTTYRFFQLTLCLLAFSLAGYAQGNPELGLILRGRLSEGKAIHKKGEVVWSGKLLMEFENKGTKPIILINPSLSFGTGLSKVEFYFSGFDRRAGGHQAVKDALGFTKAIERTPAQTETLQSLSNIFDNKQPPDNLVVTIKPGETLQFEEPLHVVQSYSYTPPVYPRNGKPALAWEGSTDWFQDPDWNPYEVGLALGQADFVRLTYEFPVGLFSDSPELFDKLNHRWKPFGQFPLNQSGAYQIVAEPIPVKKGFEKIGWPEARPFSLNFYSF